MEDTVPEFSENFTELYQNYSPQLTDQEYYNISQEDLEFQQDLQTLMAIGE